MKLHIKRRFIIGMLLAVLTFPQHVNAQMMVYDFTNYVAALEQMYTLVDQLNAMYTFVTNSYDQIQATIKMMKELDMDKLDAGDPLESLRSVMTYADRMMTYEENIERILTTRTMQWGDENFSLMDVYQSEFWNPENVGKTLVTIADPLDDPFEKEYTDDEKALFYRKYGMKPAHYKRYQAIGREIADTTKEVVAYAGNMIDTVSEDRKRLDTLAKIVESEEVLNSQVAQLQLSNMIMVTQAQDIKTLSTNVAHLAKLFANSQYEENLRRSINESQTSIDEQGTSTAMATIYGNIDENDFGSPIE